MTTTLNSFKSETQLGTTATDLASTSNAEKAFIGKATFTNTSASNVVVTVYRLPTTSTETAGVGGNWSVSRTVPAGKTWICNEIIGQSLGHSMTLSATADTASVINADISGTLEV